MYCSLINLIYIYTVGAIALFYHLRVTITVTVSVEHCFESAIAPIFLYIYSLEYNSASAIDKQLTAMCLSSYD